MYCNKLQLPPEPLTRGLRPQISVLSVLCPQLNLLKTPEKNPGYATEHYNLKLDANLYVLRLMPVNCTNCMVSSEMNFFSHTPVDIWTSEIPNTNLYTIFYVLIRLTSLHTEINPFHHNSEVCHPRCVFKPVIPNRGSAVPWGTANTS